MFEGITGQPPRKFSSPDAGDTPAIFCDGERSMPFNISSSEEDVSEESETQALSRDFRILLNSGVVLERTMLLTKLVYRVGLHGCANEIQASNISISLKY